MADVTFTYTSGGTQVVKVLRWVDRLNSREALGLWHVDNKAWKVYATRNHFDDLSADYNRAAIDATLPMGNPSFQQGTVQRGTATPTQGFVLMIKWMTGTIFLRTASSFRAALNRENFTHDRNTDDYRKLKRGCDGANLVGLRDCQGFIESDAIDSISFIDIHTSWNRILRRYGHSELAKSLVDEVEDWGH